MTGCKYCDQCNAEREEQMTFIAELSVSKLYLYREQSYPGRCVLVYKEHIHKLTGLSETAYELFMKDVRHAAVTLTDLYAPDKINYLILGDTCLHLHMHLVPKYLGGKDFGAVFSMVPDPPVYLSKEEETEAVRKISEGLAKNLPKNLPKSLP